MTVLRHFLCAALPPSATPGLTRFLESKLDKRRRGVLGPPAGQAFRLFLDDVHLPHPDAFGSRRHPRPTTPPEREHVAVG